jgi:CelD/BcsL family acetyltransferase involved in cellulose biosynthesis
MSVRAEPLARPGREGDVAEALAEWVANARPKPDILSLEGIGGSRWPDLFQRSWPGKRSPGTRRRQATVEPTVSLADRTFEQWLNARSTNFRKHMRRGRRTLEEMGAVFRTTCAIDQLAPDLAAFSRLQRKRWGPVGLGIGDDVVAMLTEAGERLLGSMRFRLSLLEVNAQPISCDLFVAAGGEVTCWLGSFDQAWASYSPGMHSMLSAIELAWSLGDRRVGLGPGTEPFKSRFADAEDSLEWWVLAPPGLRVPRTPAQAVPWSLRESMTARLSPRTIARIHRLLRGRRSRDEREQK